MLPIKLLPALVFRLPALSWIPPVYVPPVRLAAPPLSVVAPATAPFRVIVPSFTIEAATPLKVTVLLVAVKAARVVLAGTVRVPLVTLVAPLTVTAVPAKLAVPDGPLTVRPPMLALTLTKPLVDVTTPVLAPLMLITAPEPLARTAPARLPVVVRLPPFTVVAPETVPAMLTFVVLATVLACV